MQDRDAYDHRVRMEIELWKNPPPPRTAFGKMWRRVSDEASDIGDAAFETGPGKVVASAIQGLVDLLNDGMSWTVRTEAILKEFRADGFEDVQSLDDVRALRLADVDRVVGYLPTKYVAAAAAEGAAAGVAGVFGIPVDIAALVGLSLRAINEYATYYGFDLKIPNERAFAASILSTDPAAISATGKQVFVAVAAKTAERASRTAWRELEKDALVRAMRIIANRLGVRLTKAKLAQALPILGALVGAGFNAFYVSEVCRAADMAYRERFLDVHGSSAPAAAR